MSYDPTKFPNRNDVYEFARRARKNLEFVIEAERDGADVHPITQVVCSLTGIAVFPWEDGLPVFETSAALTDVFDRPPLTFHVHEGKIDSFGELMRAVRNSVSHRDIKFDSDSRKLADVSVHLTERWKKNGATRTILEFRGDQLVRLCDGILAYACRRTG